MSYIYLEEHYLKYMTVFQYKPTSISEECTASFKAKEKDKQETRNKQTEQEQEQE
jgi:hypothetical protein